MEPSRRVLVVEDDPQLAGMLEELLTMEGYDVQVAPDGQRGLHLGLTGAYDVMVLDRGLPAIEGLDLLRRLRSAGMATPVLVLSAQALSRDRVVGLDAGADDYLVKPFALDELLARLRALLRRPADLSSRIPVPGGFLVPESRTVVAAAGEVTLSAREAALLEVLARRPRQVFGREELLRSVFSGAEEPGAVDTYVHYLRRKLGKHVVETVHGLGYRLGAG